MKFRVSMGFGSCGGWWENRKCIWALITLTHGTMAHYTLDVQTSSAGRDPAGRAESQDVEVDC